MTSSRARLPLPFGEGLDRTTGPMAVGATAQEDLRNVHLLDGFAYLSNGSVEAAECTDPADDLPMTAVMAGLSFKAQGVGLLIAYRSETRAVKIFRVTRAGTAPLHVADWFTLAEGAQEPPQFWMAEVAGQMFMAHDETALSLREATVGYDPATTELTPITAEWAHEDGIRFRGITAHLGAYLCGWGYGSATEARSDLVRMSLPGEPTVFQLRHYESIGQRADQILSCFSTGHTLLCFKQAESWEHFGTDRHNFGKRQLDPMCGILAPHLGVVVDSDAAGGAGTCYLWTPLGPRASTGGAPVDLELPLGIFFPEPSDLAALGSAKTAFAAYLPSRRQVRFHFDERYYAFDIVRKQWSYGELGYTAACAFALPGIAADASEPGIAAALEVITDVYGEELSTRDVTLRWTNGSMVGDELLELWIKQAAGDWTLSATIPVEADDTQEHTFDELGANEDEQFQIRASRNGEYREEYRSDDPADWPATSYLAYTTEDSVPVLEAIVWDAESETAEHVTLAWTGTDPGRDTRVWKKIGAGAYAQIATVGAGLNTYDDAPDFGSETGEDLTYYIDQDGGTPSNEETLADLGLPAPQTLAQMGATNRWYEYEVGWDMPANMSDLVTRVEDDYLCNGNYAAQVVTVAGAAGATNTVQKDSAMDPNGNQPIVSSVRARHEVTIGMTTFTSAWRTINVNLEIAPDETAHNSCP